MKRLFVLLAKLVGLMQAYWALISFAQVGYMLSVVGSSESNELSRMAVTIAGVGIYFILSLGMAWILLFRTEWMADKLKIQDEAGIEGADKSFVLLIGVKLIGVYIAVQAIPGLASALLNTLGAWVGQSERNKIISTAIQLGIGLFLALKSERVVHLIKETTNGHE